MIRNRDQRTRNSTDINRNQRTRNYKNNTTTNNMNGQQARALLPS